MSLLFSDSFDHYATGDPLQKWSAFESSSVGQSISGSGGRRGSQGWTSIASGRGLQRGLATSVDTVIVGLALFVPTTPTTSAVVLDFYEGGTLHGTLQLNNDGSLKYLRSATQLAVSSAGVITTNAYHYVECKVKIHDTTGTVDVRVNGGSVISVSGVDTRNAGPSGLVSAVSFELPVVSAVIDDFYLANVLGGVNDDFLGDVRVDWYPANADGALNEFARISGSANYEMVDDATPDGDSTYVYESIPNRQELYNTPDMTHVPLSIKGVQGIVSARKSDAGNRTHTPLIRSGSTIYPGSAVQISTAYLMFTDMRNLDPDTSSAWTSGGVNALQVGSKVA